MSFHGSLNLKDFLAQNPSLSVELLRRCNSQNKIKRNIILEIAKCVQFCHAHGVLHKDIKLENIMINQQGEVRLIDFGYSEFMSEESSPQTRFCGTPYYFPPEFILKRNKKGNQGVPV